MPRNPEFRYEYGESDKDRQPDASQQSGPETANQRRRYDAEQTPDIEKIIAQVVRVLRESQEQFGESAFSLGVLFDQLGNPIVDHEGRKDPLQAFKKLLQDSNDFIIVENIVRLKNTSVK